MLVHQCYGLEELPHSQQQKQAIWYNRNIEIANKCIFYAKFYNAGMFHVSDRFETDGNTLTFVFWKEKGVRTSSFMRWAGIISYVNRAMVLDPNLKEAIIQNVKHTNASIDYIRVYGRIWYQISSKYVYQTCIEMKYGGDHMNTPRASIVPNTLQQSWHHWILVYKDTNVLSYPNLSQNLTLKSRQILQCHISKISVVFTSVTKNVHTFMTFNFHFSTSSY